jgi:hypothetical protein
MSRMRVAEGIMKVAVLNLLFVVIFSQEMAL